MTNLYDIVRIMGDEAETHKFIEALKRAGLEEKITQFGNDYHYIVEKGAGVSGSDVFNTNLPKDLSNEIDLVYLYLGGQDLERYFVNSAICHEMTCWKQQGRDYRMIFLVLEPNSSPQSCLQKVGNSVTRLDFMLREVNGKVVFNDLTTKKGWYLDLSELHQGKFQLVGDGQPAVFFREPIEHSGLPLA